MRLYTFVLIILVMIVLIPDIFFYLKLKKHKVNIFIHILNFLPTIFFLSAFLYMKFSGTEIQDAEKFHIFMWINFIFILIYIPKLFYLIFHFLNFLINLFLKQKFYLLRIAGALVAMFTVVMLMHGAFVNPKNIDLRKVEIEVKNLPVAFEGYKIVQISDIHLGSWGKNHSYLKPAVKIINNESADLLVFTGDLVNNFSAEMEGWDSLFIQMQAKDGKYAILGNHDYGDYSTWKKVSQKAENLRNIKQNIQNFGFTLLTNQFVSLKRDSSEIELLGVENWGKPPFPKYGNLKKTLSGSKDNVLKILLSHDPSHWRGEVLGQKNIFLTLSGHTHAAQMAFNMYGKLRSPSSLIYDEWDGLYQEDNQFLYINRGLGFIGIPVRLGVARPEVTSITLKRKK